MAQNGSSPVSSLLQSQSPPIFSNLLQSPGSHGSPLVSPSLPRLPSLPVSPSPLVSTSLPWSPLGETGENEEIGGDQSLLQSPPVASSLPQSPQSPQSPVPQSPPVSSVLSGIVRSSPVSLGLPGLL